LCSKFFAGDEVSWAVEKGGQNLKRLTVEAEFDAAFSQLAGMSVELEDVETEDAGGWRTRFGHTDSGKAITVVAAKVSRALCFQRLIDGGKFEKSWRWGGLRGWAAPSRFVRKKHGELGYREGLSSREFNFWGRRYVRTHEQVSSTMVGRALAGIAFADGPAGDGADGSPACGSGKAGEGRARINPAIY
jgi:hypothetical protein